MKLLFKLPAEERTLEIAIENAEAWANSVLKSPYPSIILDIQKLFQRYFSLEDPRALEVKASNIILTAKIPVDTLPGLIARLDRLDGEMGTSEDFTVVKYMAGRVLFEEELDEVWQRLALYATIILVKKKYKADTVAGKVLYLGDEPKILHKTFTTAELLASVDLMQSTRERVIDAYVHKKFEPKLSTFCGTCPCRGQCSLYEETYLRAEDT